MTFERYRLILTHEYIDKKGVAHKLEDPICTDYSIMLDGINPPPAVIINEMLERLRQFMLNSVEQESRNMSGKKLNCKNCEYKYCPFRGSDREISAFFCEDYEPAEEGET